MKYIDADKLKTELNKRIELLENGDAHSEVMKRVEGIIKGYKATLTFINSLQQGQPKQKKNCNDCPHCVDRKDQFGWHFKGCLGGPYNGKFIAEIDECPLQQEQPEVDFEIGKYMTSNLLKKRDHSTGIFHLTQKDYATIARHFYEFGLNARKEE